MDYFKELTGLFTKIEVSDGKGKALAFDTEMPKITDLVRACGKRGGKVMIIGNGGSASIASHITTDLLKNCGVPSIAFNDASLITCISNDLGYEHVFEKPLDILAKEGDMLFAISSSGQSKNILNAAKRASQKGCTLVTFSGFKKDNPLRTLGDVNFYVPSSSYGNVEIAHKAICHIIVDLITAQAR